MSGNQPVAAANPIVVHPGYPYYAGCHLIGIPSFRAPIVADHEAATGTGGTIGPSGLRQAHAELVEQEGHVVRLLAHPDRY